MLLACLLCTAQTRWVSAQADTTLPKKWRGLVKVIGPLGAPPFART